MLFDTNLPLNNPPGQPFEAVELCQCVPFVPQPADKLCWAACIEALNWKTGFPERLPSIASEQLHCSPEQYIADQVDDPCNRGIPRERLESVWSMNHQPDACYVADQIRTEDLRDHLTSTGPVQIVLGDWHLVLLDRLKQGPNGTVIVRLMDPMTHQKRLEVYEAALREGDDEKWIGMWTGTVTGLRSKNPSDCSPALCGDWEDD